MRDMARGQRLTSLLSPRSGYHLGLEQPKETRLFVGAGEGLQPTGNRWACERTLLGSWRRERAGVSLSEVHRKWAGRAAFQAQDLSLVSPQGHPENSELHASLKLFSFTDQLILTREQWLYKAGRKPLAVRGWEEFPSLLGIKNLPVAAGGGMAPSVSFYWSVSFWATTSLTLMQE